MSSSTFLSALECFKWLSAAAYVVSTIGVTIGVHWEDKKFSEKKQRCGHKLLIWCLSADTLFTIFVFAADGGISAYQQAEIIRLTTPRDLSTAQIDGIAAKVCTLGPKPYDIIYVVYDEILFNGEMSEILDGSCKWERKPYPDQIAEMRAASGVVGIHFLYNEEHASEFREVAEAFAAALTAAGVMAETDEIPKGAPLNVDMIRIQIGRRP
jgi:hypothetical protein